jgi:hypothetical protein
MKRLITFIGILCFTLSIYGQTGQLKGKVSGACKGNPLTNMLAKSNNKSALGLNWIEMGPNNVGGRTRAILIDKNNINTVYAGGVSGGLWRSTSGGTSWIQIPTMADNFAVSSIAQAPNGDIYVGTGEGLSFNGEEGNINGGTAFVGNGIFKSTDNGNTFTLLSSTEPIANAEYTAWACVNKLACNPVTGRVFAATNKGIRMSDDGGATWINPVHSTPAGPLDSASATDVDVASDGTVIVAVGNICYISPDGSDNSFINKSTGGAGLLPSSGLSGIEFAIAPSNPNYIYCSAAATDGSLNNVYKSTDKGNTWAVIGPGGSASFVPFGDNKTGKYDNTLAVFPNDPDHILLGGVDMWEWENGSTWTQKTLWSLSTQSSLYIHSGHHIYVFPTGNSSIIYVGSDGGISKSTDSGATWLTMNIGYNVTQFYTVACSGNGAVMGGTSENGTQYLSMTLAPPQDMNASQIYGSYDGGGAAFSNINPNAFFASSYYGGIGRSALSGSSFSSFISSRMTNAGIGTNANSAAQITPLLLWESLNDPYTNDWTTYSDTCNLPADTTITVISKNNAYPFQYTLPSAYTKGDTILVRDIIQTKLFLGVSNGVWMTRRPLDFSATPKWYKISNFIDMVQTMALSQDGNYLFAGTETGVLERISNLRYASGSTVAADSMACEYSTPFCVIETKKLTGLPSGGLPITSIAVDPSNANHIIVTLGYYDNDTYIYESTNALDQSPTFTAKQGNLPAMPVYSSLIPLHNPHAVILGTEHGIYSTDSISAASPVWTAENSGMSQVPVYMIRQQTYDFPYVNSLYPGVNNYGMIYIATHGRGIFKCDKYLSVPENPITNISAKPSLHLYPNPVVDKATISFNLTSSERVVIKVYDLTGRMVKVVDLSNLKAGNHEVTMDCSTLKNGTYIINLISGNNSSSAKFVVN